MRAGEGSQAGIHTCLQKSDNWKITGFMGWGLLLLLTTDIALTEQNLTEFIGKIWLELQLSKWIFVLVWKNHGDSGLRSDNAEGISTNHSLAALRWSVKAFRAARPSKLLVPIVLSRHPKPTACPPALCLFMC